MTTNSLLKAASSMPLNTFVNAEVWGLRVTPCDTFCIAAGEKGGIRALRSARTGTLTNIRMFEKLGSTHLSII